VNSRFDPGTGLYSTLQDSQDEYQKLPFNTYHNVLTWKALLSLSDLLDGLHDSASAREMSLRAEALKKAIWKYCISDKAPGATGAIFAFATDGKNSIFEDTPPGSLLKLPALGFLAENDPVFVRTYEWLRSPAVHCVVERSRPPQSDARSSAGTEGVARQPVG
jgi:meiotically up-regulated gene 157 (Mug157) protein